MSTAAERERGRQTADRDSKIDRQTETARQTDREIQLIIISQ